MAAAALPAGTTLLNPYPSAAGGPAKIAFLMPCSTCAPRFEEQDRPDFIAAVKKLDPSIEVTVTNAQGSVATIIQQAEAALTNGANVLVAEPFDMAAGAAIVAKAHAAHVPFVSYDALITNAPVDFWVSFDGALQAQYLLDHLAKGSSVAILNGAPGNRHGLAS